MKERCNIFRAIPEYSRETEERYDDITGYSVYGLIFDLGISRVGNKSGLYYTNVLKVVKFIDSYQRVCFACLQQHDTRLETTGKGWMVKIIIKAWGNRNYFIGYEKGMSLKECHVFGAKLAFDPQTSQAGATHTKTEPRLIDIPAHICPCLSRMTNHSPKNRRSFSLNWT